MITNQMRTWETSRTGSSGASSSTSGLGQGGGQEAGKGRGRGAWAQSMRSRGRCCAAHACSFGQKWVLVGGPAMRTHGRCNAHVVQDARPGPTASLLFWVGRQLDCWCLGCSCRAAGRAGCGDLSGRTALLAFCCRERLYAASASRAAKVGQWLALEDHGHLEAEGAKEALASGTH
jgi:hypothetical protein